MQNTHRGQDVLLGAVAGGMIAALTTLLLVTKPGKKLQHQVVSKFLELEDDAKELFLDSKEKVEDASKKATHVAKKESHKDEK